MMSITTTSNCAQQSWVANLQLLNYHVMVVATAQMVTVRFNYSRSTIFLSMLWNLLTLFCLVINKPAAKMIGGQKNCLTSKDSQLQYKICGLQKDDQVKGQPTWNVQPTKEQSGMLNVLPSKIHGIEFTRRLNLVIQTNFGIHGKLSIAKTKAGFLPWSTVPHQNQLLPIPLKTPFNEILVQTIVQLFI